MQQINSLVKNFWQRHFADWSNAVSKVSFIRIIIILI